MIKPKEKEKQVTETAISEEERTISGAERGGKTAPGGMPVCDGDEPWVQQHRKDFGEEPGFF